MTHTRSIPTPTLTITPLKPCVPHNNAAEISVMITLGCPPRPVDETGTRVPLNLAIALDRSSSMAGSPMEEAKRSACRVVESLHDDDRFSLVAYDHQMLKVVPGKLVGRHRKDILSAISAIRPRGNTNLHGGWLAAAEEAATGMKPGMLTRVIVLSDGNTNSGIQDVEQIAKQVTALADTGVTTSTIGLGVSFNEDLMTSVAQAGGGMSTYGETAEDLWPSFEAEFGLLSATCGREAVLSLRSPCGARVAIEGLKPLSILMWRLPDLVYGAQLTILAKLTLDGQGQSDLAGLCSLLDAEVTWKHMDGTEGAAILSHLEVPVRSFADFVISPSDPAVAARLLEAEASELQMQAKAAANRHDFATVESIADKMLTMAPDSAWITGMAGTLHDLSKLGDSALISKEAIYASSKLRASSYTTSTALSSDDVPEFLRKRTRQGNSSTSTR